MAHKKASPKTVATSAPIQNDQRYFRIKEAAIYLRAKPWTIAAAIREKKLAHIQLGKSYVLLREDLDKFAAENRVAA